MYLRFNKLHLIQRRNTCDYVVINKNVCDVVPGIFVRGCDLIVNEISETVINIRKITRFQVGSNTLII